MTQPTKDELIKARECLEELVGWAHEGQMFASRVHECENLINKALDAQIKACDVPKKIEALGEYTHMGIDLASNKDQFFFTVRDGKGLYSVIEPIKGLGEVLDSVIQYPLCNDLGFLSATDRSILLQAARAYYKLTGGR
jgi:hypothetical protein